MQSREKQRPDHKHPRRHEENKRPKNRRQKNPIKRCPPGTDGHRSAKTPTKDQMVSADGKGSTQNVFKSRLVPPRPARDILLDHRAVMLSLSAAEEKKPSGEDVNCSVGGLEQGSRSTGLDKEGLISSSWKSSEEDTGSNTSSLTKDQERTCDVGTQTPGNHLEEWELHGIDERTRWPAGAGDSSFCKELHHLAHPEVQSPETKLEPEGDGPPRSRRIRKNLEDQRISEARTNQILRGFLEHTMGQVSDSTFQGLVHHWRSVTEMTKVFSEVLISLHKWIIDLDNLMTGGVESDQRDAGPEESLRRISHLSAEGLMHGSLNQLKEDPACLEVPLAGWLTAQRSVRSDMFQSSGSTDQQEKQAVKEESETKGEDFGGHPAVSKSAASETEDFVFVDSYFAEPLRSGVRKLIPHGGQQMNYQGSFPDNYYHNDRQQRTEDGKLVGQSSKVRRLIETTAEEIKAMAVPELVLVSLQEGRQLNGPPWLNVGSPQQQLSGDMDSCEEADEEQDSPPGEKSGVREETTMEEEVQPASSTKPEGDQEGGPLDHRREEDTDCKLS